MVLFTTVTRSFKASSRMFGSIGSKSCLFSTLSHDIPTSPPASGRGSAVLSLLPSYLTSTPPPSSAPPLLNLSIAENRINNSQDLLTAKMTSLQESSHGQFTPDMIYYQNTYGTEGCREAFASYLSSTFLPKRNHKRNQNQKNASHGFTFGFTFNPSCLTVGAGCNAVLENLIFCLSDVGEGVMIPCPYYATFAFDLGARAQAKILPVRMPHMPHMPHMGEQQPGQQQQQQQQQPGQQQLRKSDYYPTLATLNASYDAGVEAGVTPRILLLSNPNNPLGICYPPEVLKMCFDFVVEKEMHLISDEIYGGSTFNEEGAESESNSDSKFTSIASIASFTTTSSSTSTSSSSTSSSSSSSTTTSPSSPSPSHYLHPRAHLVYALSKDFALSGLRVGACYTENESVLAPLRKLNDLCQVSSSTQKIVEGMLRDEKWVTRFSRSNLSKVKGRYDRLAKLLKREGVEFLRAEAGLYVWMDLRPYLRPYLRPQGGGRGSLVIDL